MLQPDRPHGMCFAWWVTKVTDTHSQNAIFIALPRQPWLRERSTLRLYVNCLSCLRGGDVSPSPYLRLWDHSLSALHDCLFSVFTATFHIWRPSPSETWGHAIPWWKEAIYRATLNTYSNIDILHRSQCPRGLKADSHIACRAHAVPPPCRAAKGLESLSHLIYTVRPCLIHKNVKCESDTAALCKSDGKDIF
jgi:hypothetical protein